MANVCCPAESVYVDAYGNYSDPSPGVGNGKVSNPDDPGVLNACNNLRNIVPDSIAFATPTGQPPIDCLCCPSEYTYSSFVDKCVSAVFFEEDLPGFPCIPCICPDAQENTCTDCGTSGQPIYFQLDILKSNCVNCSPQDNNGPSCLEPFLPPNFLDPIIDFKLRNKNFI